MYSSIETQLSNNQIFNRTIGVKRNRTSLYQMMRNGLLQMSQSIIKPSRDYQKMTDPPVIEKKTSLLDSSPNQIELISTISSEDKEYISIFNSTNVLYEELKQNCNFNINHNSLRASARRAKANYSKVRRRRKQSD